MFETVVPEQEHIKVYVPTAEKQSNGAKYRTTYIRKHLSNQSKAYFSWNEEQSYIEYDSIEDLVSANYLEMIPEHKERLVRVAHLLTPWYPRLDF